MASSLLDLVIGPAIQPTADLFDRAADYLQEHGLCKGDYTNRGRVCMLGAIKAAAGLDPAGPDTRLAAAVRHAEGFVPSAFLLSEWNDVRSRRKADVVRKLREIADSLR